MEPLTIAFHKARSRAEWLRPDNIDDMLGDRPAQLDYRDAVHEYTSAFDVAEAEAVRRKISTARCCKIELLRRIANYIAFAGQRK